MGDVKRKLRAPTPPFKSPLKKDWVEWKSSWRMLSLCFRMNKNSRIEGTKFKICGSGHKVGYTQQERFKSIEFILNI